MSVRRHILGAPLWVAVALAGYAQTASAGTLLPVGPIFDGSVSTRYGGLGFALDSLGTPAVTYQGTGGGLCYAIFDGDEWVAESVETGTYNGQSSSLTFDGTTPLIAYRGANSSNVASVKYATHSGASWLTDTIYNTATTDPDHTAIKVDSSGSVSVAWIDRHLVLDFNDDTVDWSRLTGGSWVHEVVGNDPLANGDVDLGVPDGAAYADVAYIDGNWLSQFATFAERDGTWSAEAVENPFSEYGGEAAYVAMDYDASGNPVMAYMDTYSGDIIFTRKTTTGWVSEVAYDGTEWYAFNDLRYLDMGVDSAGIPHIVFYDPEANRLMYVDRAYGEWQPAKVLAEDTEANWVRVEVDENDQTHYCFFNANSGDNRIYYGIEGAVPEPGTWLTFALGLAALVWWRRRRAVAKDGPSGE